MKRCLVVDDSKVVRMVARKILESLNFQIEEAENGQAAMDICKRAMPDAILLDWNMPVMNGMDFLKGLRRMDGSKQPVVVFCTTENDLKIFGSDHRRRRRIHHEALRQRDHRVEVQSSRPALNPVTNISMALISPIAPPVESRTQELADG